MLADAHLRIARPTNDIVALLPFYRDGLGFEVVGTFEDHQGFDGIMLQHPQAAYHLEFTQHRNHVVSNAPSQEHLLVFYLSEADQWRKAVKRMEQAGFAPHVAFNPYWDVHGKTFEDADGYRVVLQQAAWSEPPSNT